MKYFQLSYVCEFLILKRTNLISSGRRPRGLASKFTYPRRIFATALGWFLGQLHRLNSMLGHLADFATPLHASVHRTPFRWTNTEDKAYEAWKVMLSQAPVVQPSDWTRPFHVYVDASDIAIGSALMQHMAANWYRPIYYSSRKLSTVERNYSTTEREALGLIYNINKFHHYLLGKKFTFHVDHATLLYLVSN